jgi:hypothetical protein
MPWPWFKYLSLNDHEISCWEGSVTKFMKSRLLLQPLSSQVPICLGWRTQRPGRHSPSRPQRWAALGRKAGSCSGEQGNESHAKFRRFPRTWTWLLQGAGHRAMAKLPSALFTWNSVPRTQWLQWECPGASHLCKSSSNVCLNDDKELSAIKL